jgi:hypothetical protein
VYRVAEAGHPEMVIPLDPARRHRARALLGQTARMVGFADGGIPSFAGGGQPPGTQPGGSGDTPAFRASGFLNNDFGVDKWNRDIATALNAGGRPAIQAAMRSTHVKTAFAGLVELQAGIFGRGGGPASGGLTEKDLAAVKEIPGLSLEDYTPGVNIGYAAALSRVRGGYNSLRSILMNAANGSAAAKQTLAQLTSNSWHFGAAAAPQPFDPTSIPGTRPGSGGPGDTGGGGGSGGPIPFLARGAYVKRRPGGLLARIGEGANDEMVIPVPSGASTGSLGSGVSINELHVHNEVDAEHVVSKLSRSLFMQSVQ